MFIALILIFIISPVILAGRYFNDVDKEKPFTSVSLQLLFAVFMSILLAVAIALNADIPASSGHGGLIYIIGPSLFGLFVFILYLASLGIRPKLKFVLGLVSILINISIGFYYMLTDF